MGVELKEIQITNNKYKKKYNKNYYKDKTEDSR
jgi:hypothetical protein